jgi:hypothetical protein
LGDDQGELSKGTVYEIRLGSQQSQRLVVWPMVVTRLVVWPMVVTRLAWVGNRTGHVKALL